MCDRITLQPSTAKDSCSRGPNQLGQFTADGAKVCPITFITREIRHIARGALSPRSLTRIGHMHTMIRGPDAGAWSFQSTSSRRTRLLTGQDSLRCRVLHQLRQNSAATRSKKQRRRAPGLLSVKFSRKHSWHNTVKHHMHPHGKLCFSLPLSMWRGIVETSWRSTGLGVGLPVMNHRHIRRHHRRSWSSALGCTETATVEQWDLDRYFLQVGFVEQGGLLQYCHDGDPSWRINQVGTYIMALVEVVQYGASQIVFSISEASQCRSESC